MRTISTSVLTLLFAVTILSAKVIRVPKDFAKIQLAIEAAVNGDTVLVSEGTYFENLLLKKKIVLGSLYIMDGDTSHISKTILDGSNPRHADSASVILITTGADSSTMIAGFTIRNGRGMRWFDAGANKYWRGGFGISINAGGANIHHNVITGGSLTTSDGVFGGGIAVAPMDGALSYWIIENNQIRNNNITSTATTVVAAEGGGAWLTRDGRFNNNVVENNSAVGVVYGAGGGIHSIGITGYGNNTIEMSNNLIRGNSASHWGGGIISGVDASLSDILYVTMKNNIISGNTAAQLGGAMHFQGGTFTLINNTIVNNVGPQAWRVESVRGSLTMRLLNNIVWNPNCTYEILQGGGSYAKSIAVLYSDVRGGFTGTGNIDVEPFFIPNDSLFHLSDSSYCIARGIDSATIYGVLCQSSMKDYVNAPRPQPSGSMPDMGAIEHALGVQRLFAQVTTETRQFFSQSLNQNRTVMVHKPNSISAASPCPVLIFLPGRDMTPAQFNMFNSVMVSLLNTNKLRPILIVVPDGSGGIYGQSLFANSYVNGNFGDYIVKDLVKWIKQEYPVKLNRRYWILGGFSMGGGGCARLALSSPDVFSGFASFSGDIMFDRLTEMFNYINSIECPNFIYWPPTEAKEYTYIAWGIASTFSPDSTNPYKCQFPLVEGTGQMRDSVFGSWLKSDALTLARNYFVVNHRPADSLNIYIRIGINDPYISLGSMGRYFSDSLTSWGITHNYGAHSFGHDFNSTLATSLLVWTDSLFQLPTLVSDTWNVAPREFELSQNYPNPFNPSTTFRYALPSSVKVKLTIHDILGREIATLVNEEQSAGWKEVQWDASSVASGIYFYRLQAGKFVETKKMLLVR